VRAELDAERRWIAEEEKERQAALKSARSRAITAEKVDKLRPQLLRRIQSAAPEDRRFVLECLSTETTVGPSGVQLSLEVPESVESSVYTRPRAGAWEQEPFVSRVTDA
jgi:hypothetical protein